MTSKARNLSNLVADDGQLEIDVVRHSVRPSLLLDFANSKQLDPRITFSRASTGTYYDGKTFAKAEENLIYPSQEFTYIPTSRFTQENNTSPAPDGTNTATEIRETSINDFHDATHSTNITYAGETTISAYVKPIGRQYLYIYTSSSPNYSRVFDIVNGTVQTGYYSSGSQAAGSITDAGNGWYRVSITFTSTNSNKKIVFGTILSGGNFDSGFTGDTNKGFYVWGVQVETRSAPTAYTPTTTQPITNYIPVLQTAAAGTARFDHDPVTGESKGLLIEEQRTNLLTYSEDFSDSDWTKSNASVDSNVIVAPDGTLTGCLLTASSNEGGVAQFSKWSTTQSTGSVYAKAGTASTISIDNGSTSGTGVVFNISNGTIVSEQSGFVGGIEYVGNGWYRCFATHTAAASQTFVVKVMVSGTSAYIWGAQLEAGAFPTSYIKTTSAQATRNADAASMTGTNFSSWYRQDEGTVYGDFNCFHVDSSVYDAPAIFSISNNTVNNRWSVFIDNGTFSTRLVRQGFVSTDYPVISGGTHTSGTQQKISYAVGLNQLAAIGYDGNTYQATTSPASMPVVDRLYIGARYDGGYKLNGTIKKLSYYPTRLTNAELQALTEE